MKHDVRLAAFALALAVGSSEARATGDSENGKRVFKKCRSCHMVGENAANLVGPVLNGVVGRKSGMSPGYNYSDALKTLGATWDEATLYDYLKNPRAYVPDAKMTFTGVPDEKERADVIAYLATIGPDGKPK